MKRFDFVGGLFVRVGRWWLGLVATFPFVVRVPLICGGTDALSSQDTYISYGDSDSPNTFTELGEVKSIGGPNESADEKDVTHLRSPQGYKEFLQMFKDGGEVPLTTNFLAGNVTHLAVRALFASGAIRGWKITYPDTSIQTFDAWVKACGSTASVGSELQGTFTLRIVGQVTLDPA